MNRREALKWGVSAGAAMSLSGCFGGGEEKDVETSQTEEPTVTPSPKETDEESTSQDSSGEPDKSGGDGGLWLQAVYEHPKKILLTP